MFPLLWAVMLSAGICGAQGLHPYLSVQPEGTAAFANGSPLEFDQTKDVTLCVKKTELLEYLLEHGAPSDKVLSIRSRLDFIGKVSVALDQSQSKLIAFKRADLRLHFAAAKDLPQAQKERDAASDAFAKSDPFLELRELAKGDPELKKRLNQAVLIGSDYSGLVQVVQVELDKLQSDLEIVRKQVRKKYGVLLSADLINGDGQVFPVHLRKYDQVRTGPRQPLQRFQFVVDRQTLAELDAAKAATTLANTILDGSSRAELIKSLESFDLALKEAPKKIDEMLKSLLTQLKSLSDPQTQALRAELAKLENELEALNLDTLLPPKSTANIADLLDSLIRKVQQAKALVEGMPERVSALGRQMESAAALLEGAAVTALKRDFESLKASLPAFLTQIQATVITPVLSLRNDLESLVGIGSGLQEVSRKARSLAPEDPQDLNDWFNLGDFDSSGNRYTPKSGDVINIKLSISEYDAEGKATEMDSVTRSLKARLYGPFSEARGTLIFVRASSSSGLDANTKAYPALCFNLKIGMKDSELWNDFLSPGLGLSFSLMNLDPKKEMEVGVALNVTLLKDIFSVGYGYDLQARCKYSYIGINPLVLYNLYKQLK